MEIRSGTNGPNLVSNPDFESGTNGWTLLGCFSRSGVDTNGAGYLSASALHLRTGDRLFTMANSATCTLTNATILTNGMTATMRLKARWLKGNTDLVFRLNGNWLEAAGTLPVPRNLGTPGWRNSRAVTNAGPAVFAVSHAPSMPAAGQACVVTARGSDPDGVASLTLNYRVDPASSYTALVMRDDGTGGDAVAGDGVFSATIPGQGSNALVAFVITASDNTGATSRFPALLTDKTPARECLVRFGEPQPPMSFGTYHFWISQNTINRWIALPVLANEDEDITFVCGNRIIYNAFCRYAGSPYHQAFTSPLGPVACHYNLAMPKDDKFLGAVSFNKIHWVGNDIQNDTGGFLNVNDATLQREQTANTFFRGLGVPWIYRRFVRLYVNGVQRGQLMEDAQRPSVSVPDEYFPGDTGGFLYKIQPWFEGTANVTSGNYWPWANETWAYLLNITTTGGAKKTPRYRWWYETRQSPDSMSNFTNVFSLQDASVSYTNANYVSAMQNVADMENWMRVIAANHAAGNWDCYGIQNGQNLYGYVSPAHRWTLFMFDFSIVLGNQISWAPGQNLFVTPPAFGVSGADTGWAAIVTNATFRRMLLRAYKELANGAMTAPRVEPLLDAKYSAFQANGLQGVLDPSVIKTWVASARSIIASTIATEDAASFSLATNTFVTSSNEAILNGTAPVEVTTITVNGTSWPLTWTTATHWNLALPVSPGTNVWTVLGYDRFGNVVTGASNQVAVVSIASPPDAVVGSVVINEIMFNPRVPDGEFVELFNNSTNTAFDLSGWKFNGLGYTFPPGSMIAPRSFLVLARSRTVFASTYGVTVPVFDEFSGSLQLDGETLTLVQPGTPDVEVSKVRYASTVPWPTAPGGGITPASIQVIDPAQDNRRPCNWQTFSGLPFTNLNWSFASVTVTNNNSGGARLLIYLSAVGDVFLDDLAYVSGTVAGVGSNFLHNGGFEPPLVDIPRLTNSWVVATNYTNSTLSMDIKHGGSSSLHIICSNAPSLSTITTNKAIYQNFSPVPTNNQVCTLSYWYRAGASSNAIIMRNMASTFGVTNGVSPTFVTGPYSATPATTNLATTNLPPIPPLWINEVLPFNNSGLTDNNGQYEPWIELYNTGTNTVSLAGLYLANDFGTLTQWTFPTNASLGPRQFKVVIADGSPEQTTPAEWHTSFRLAATNGSVALSWMQFGQPAVLDYVTYAGVPANYSYGSVPDGQPFDRQLMYFNSPGGTNSGASAPIMIYVNEWMADNTRTLADPADGNFDDWFELYNPNFFPVDLTGWTLANSLTNGTLHPVPSGYVIPAGGFLLVWADNQTGQNSTNRIDLHTGFKLSKSGETIVVRASDGRLVDAVTFGAQTADVSEGRFPDGGLNLYFFTAPTPRSPNLIPNQPPVLAPISSSSVHVGEMVTFTASATDADSPPQTLVFSLAANAPSGASISSSSGLFAWVPPTAGVFSISVIVADNGTPSLSATQTFSVTVQSLQVAGQLALEDFVGPVLNGFGTRPVTFKATDNAGLVLAIWSQILNFVPDARGHGVASYTLTNVPLGTIHISAKTAWHLRKRLPVTFVGGRAEADFTGAATLPGGDLDGSNTVDMADFEQLAAAWYTTADVSDINGSGLVDILDYFIMASHWLQQGESE